MLDHRLIDRLSRNQDKMANLWCLEKGVWVVVNLQFLKTVLRVCKKFRQPTLFSTAMQSPSSNTMVWCGSTFCCSASGPERAMENRINSTDGPLGWKQDYYLKRNGKQYNFNLRNFCQDFNPRETLQSRTKENVHFLSIWHGEVCFLHLNTKGQKKCWNAKRFKLWWMYFSDTAVLDLPYRLHTLSIQWHLGSNPP